MIAGIPALLALGGGTPLRLVGSGALLGPVAFARPSLAWGLGADGASWVETAANTPRFHGTGRRLMVEGARTNAVRNPRFEGAVVGGPNPTNMTEFVTANSSGVSRSIVAIGELPNGLPYIDILLSGTATASFTAVPRFDTTTSTPAANGDVWTMSFFAAVVSGNPAHLTVIPSVRMQNGSGTTVGGVGVVGSALPLSATLARYAHTAMLNQADTAFVQASFRLTVASGTVCNEVLRISAPQLELASFASSPILPPPGAPAIATRAADVPAWTLPPGYAQRGTVIGRFVLPQAAPGGIDQGLLQLDNGTDGNRVVLRNAAGGSSVEAVVASGGSTLATLAGGTMMPGMPFRAALAWGSGGTALSLAGGSVQSAALPAGLSRLLIGHAASALNRATFGEIEALDLHPTRLPDAALQALSNPN
jgi:hypothetical protein